MSRAVDVLAFDGGLAHMGVVRARVTDRGEVRAIEALLFTTSRGGAVAKRGGLAGVTVSEDNRRRVQELSREVSAVLDPGAGLRPDVVVVEAFSRPPHAASGVQLGMALAVVYAWCGAFNVPVVEVSPQTVKAALGVERGLPKDASKKAVQDAVDARLWPARDGSLRDLLAGVRAGDLEHPYDAAAVILAAVERDRLRAVMPMAF